jgi:hypothetical protein
VAGERVYVPARAEFNVEHERGGKEEEIEFQLKWTNRWSSSSPARQPRISFFVSSDAPPAVLGHTDGDSGFRERPSCSFGEALNTGS